MRVLIHFLNDQHWIHFRFAELDALLELNGLNPKDVYERPQPVVDDSSQVPDPYFSPFLVAEFPDDENLAREICSRSVMIRQISRLWDICATYPELVERMKSAEKPGVDGTVRGYHLMKLTETEDLNKTWAVKVESYARSLPHAAKNSLRSGLPFQCCYTGSVQLSNPERQIILTLDFSRHSSGGGNHVEDVSAPLEEVVHCVPCYFGVLLATGGMKSELIKYDLKKRPFIGPTSLDHALSFITCNLANVTANSVVLDPFVGTASLLIAASHFGACCFGSDIDIRVLKGDMYAGQANDDRKRDIVENFKLYGLDLPELSRVDNHMFSRHFQCGAENPVLDEFYDVIITDPPYGIRAGARKSGRKGLNYTVPEEKRYEHTPHTQNYAVEEVMLDLLHTAAITLRVGGVLAYIIPTPYDFNRGDLPVHPCLECVESCVQNLSCRHGRHAVIMRKRHRYSRERWLQYKEYCASITDSTVEAKGGFGALMAKLERALSNTALKDESVVKKLSNSCVRRKTSKILRKTKNSKEAHLKATSAGDGESGEEEPSSQQVS